MHSQSLREKPLEPWVIAKNDGIILSGHCTCMAGLGESCTHVAALHFLIYATVRITDSKTPMSDNFWKQVKGEISFSVLSVATALHTTPPHHFMINY